MKQTRRVAVLIAAIAATVIAATGSAASTADAAVKRPHSQAAVAKKLAARVARAHTPASRYEAVLAVMRTLRVGIVTGKGKTLVRGGRPHEVYLYDFEIKAMAGALKRRQTNTAAELAGRLGAAGVTPGGNPLTAEQFARTLKAGMRAALARPRARWSVVPLLARELGRRQRPGYDIATAPLDRLRFDALQTFLINADVAAAASRRGGGASRVAAAGRVATAAADGRCQGWDVVKESTPLGKWVIGLIPLIKDYAKIAALVLDGIHGSILALSVGFTNVTPTTEQRTHYGPAGHDPDAGKAFDFGVRLVMRDQWPEDVINCGRLLGMKIPNKGPIPGVTVAWAEDSQVAPPLYTYGTEIFPTGQKTDAKGGTSLHFVPKDEKIPGFGSVHHAGNTKRAVALYQSAFGNVPGSVAQFLTPKEVRFPWNVAYHLPRGFKFAGMIRDNHFRQFEHPAGRWDADMHVCGDDPLAPWTGTTTYVSEGTPLTFPRTWAFVPGVPTSPIDKEYGFKVGALEGQLNLTPPFSATFTVLGYGDEQRAGPFSLPLEEAGWPECPDNTPFGSSP
jgi:hypothetical protein